MEPSNLKENPTNNYYLSPSKSDKINYYYYPSTASSSSSPPLLVTASMSFSISMAFFYVILVTVIQNTTPKYSIVIDGGSTGTRLHVLEYRVDDEGDPRFDFGPDGLGSIRVNPGLSSYAEDPDRAGESLMGLLEFAKERVPVKYRKETEIRLMATAGLRLLDVKLQERVLASCRNVLASSGFKFRDDWASVISGSDEGLYAWVIANYALGSLGGDPRNTTGIIELGGASVQLTFVSSTQLPIELSRTFKYGNVTYNLYSQSMLQFGQNAASDSVRELLVSTSSLETTAGGAPTIIDPCSPKGYVHESSNTRISSPVPSVDSTVFLDSSGNFSDCRKAASMLLRRKTEECSTQDCSIIGSSSTFPLSLDGKFLATENFFYTTKFFGLLEKVQLVDLMAAGEEFCESEWSSLRGKHPSKMKENLRRYCFSSAYIVALLHDHLGIPMEDQRIWYTNNVKNIPLDWALGAFILQTTTTAAQDAEWDTRGGITHYLHEQRVFALWVLSSIVFFLFWSLFQWKSRPYMMKTIHDLEKGGYTVTRIKG